MHLFRTSTLILILITATYSASLFAVAPSVSTTLGRRSRNREESGFHFDLKAGPTLLFKGKKKFALSLFDDEYTAYRGLTPQLGYHLNKEDDTIDHFLSVGVNYMLNSTLKGGTMSIGSELLITNDKTRQLGARVSTKIGLLNSLGVEVAYQKHLRSEMQVSLFVDIGTILFIAMNLW